MESLEKARIKYFKSIIILETKYLEAESVT